MSMRAIFFIALLLPGCAAMASDYEPSWQRQPPVVDLTPPPLPYTGFICGGAIVVELETVPKIAFWIESLPAQCVRLSRGGTPIERRMFQRCVTDARRLLTL